MHSDKMTVWDGVNLSHGGVEKSGFGRFNVGYLLEEVGMSMV